MKARETYSTVEKDQNYTVQRKRNTSHSGAWQLHLFNFQTLLSFVVPMQYPQKAA